MDNLKTLPVQMKKTFFLAVALLATAFTSNAADVKANWDQHCAKCHSADGKGQTAMGKKLKAKDYSDAKVQDALKDEELLKAIVEGVKDKETGKGLMRGYGDMFTADENKAFVPFIRAFKK